METSTKRRNMGAGCLTLVVVGMAFALCDAEDEQHQPVAEHQAQLAAASGTKSAAATQSPEASSPTRSRDAGITAEQADNFHVRVEPTVTGPFSVDVQIESNIPESPTLSVELSLEGLKPDDTFIGTDFVRVPLKGGQAQVTIDGRKRTLPHGSTLPQGNYIVEASFHPHWEENKAIAKRAGIDETITGTSSVALRGSRKPAGDHKEIQKNQRWVMENIEMGHDWNPRFWEKKFGPLDDVGYGPRGNSDILKAYYVESIDMTLIVNVLKDEIVTWRTGLAHK